MPQKLTMTEIAKLAKVSQAAVSLTLNGKGDGHVSPEKQRKIWKIVNKYNYKPNFNAQKLRQGHQAIIGILSTIPDTIFTASMISTLQQKLEAKGYLTLFSFWRDINYVKQAFQSISQYNVDGIIAWNYDDIILQDKLPTVLYSDQHQGADSVLMDYSSSIHQAIQYLINLGHRKIGYLGTFVDRRYHAFQQEMRHESLTCRDEWVINTLGHPNFGCQSMAELLKLPPDQRPTAIITHNDALAHGVYHCMTQAGLKIPDDLSVIGFDNEEYSVYMNPPLTSFELPVEMIANALIELVLAKIKHPGNPDCILSIKPKLCIRQSCADIRN